MNFTDSLCELMGIDMARQDGLPPTKWGKQQAIINRIEYLMALDNRPPLRTATTVTYPGGPTVNLCRCGVVTAPGLVHCPDAQEESTVDG